jgi:quercetin dioxygenase-like cupin family protein
MGDLMSVEETAAARNTIVLGRDEGRAYEMGRIRAVFKADGDETARAYSIAEWWLDAHTTGPGAHEHPEDNAFYVIDGTMAILVGDEWTEASKGSFVLLPGGITHTFENRSDAPAGVLAFVHPGTFEQEMPDIVGWFRTNPPADTRD